MKYYLVCYDIADDKRRRKVAKLIYAYAIGGQKSVLEVPLNKQEHKELILGLEKLINSTHDRVNVVLFDGEPLLLGKADFLHFENGVIVL